MRVLARVEFGEDEQACEFRARPDLQLAEKVQTVGLDGTLADAEAGRDFRRRQAFGDMPGRLLLAFA